MGGAARGVIPMNMQRPAANEAVAELALSCSTSGRERGTFPALGRISAIAQCLEGKLPDSRAVWSSSPLKPPCKMSVAVEEAVLPSISTFAGLVPLEDRQTEMVRGWAQVERVSVGRPSPQKTMPLLEKRLLYI